MYSMPLRAHLSGIAWLFEGLIRMAAEQILYGTRLSNLLERDWFLSLWQESRTRDTRWKGGGGGRDGEQGQVAAGLGVVVGDLDSSSRTTVFT